MSRKKRSTTATMLGWMTSITMAFVLVDFDTLNWKSVNTYVKILSLLLPAIGGHLSEIKEKQNPI